MGLDKLVDEQQEKTEQTESSIEPDEQKLTNVTLPISAWRYILKSTKCNMLIDENEMELWEVEEIIKFINHELKKKRPFGRDPADLPFKHMKRYRDRMEDKLEEMK